MANLSNVDPIAAGVQGLAGGLQNGIVLQQLMGNKQKMEREEAEAPLRTQLLQNQVTATGLATDTAKLELTAKQREAAFMNQAWDPSAEPVFKTMKPTEQAEYLDMIKKQGVPLNMAGRSLFYKGFEMNTEMFKKMKDFTLDKVNQEYANAGKMLTELQSNPNAKPEEINAARERYNTIGATRDAATGNFKKQEGIVAMNELALKHKKVFTSSPGAQMAYELAKQTGDTKGFETILQHMVANESKGITEFEAYLRGEVSAAQQDGKPVDLKKVVKDFENLKDSTNIKVGTAHNFIDGDKLITKVWDGRGWVAQAGAAPGSRWKAPNMTETNATKGWHEFVTYNTDMADMSLKEYNDMKAYQAIHGVPFPKTSRFYGKGGAPTNPSATGTPAPKAGKAYEQYLK